MTAVVIPPRTLPSLHQVQPPWFDRVLIAFRAPSITTADEWASKSRLLHLSFIHFISNNAPFLTGQLHRELAPPHWGRAQLKEPGSRNPLFFVNRIEGWTPAPSEVDSGDVATWPMDRLDVESSQDEKVPAGSDPVLLKVKVSWCSNASARSLTTPWIIVCVRLHAAAAGDIAVLDLVRHWVRYYKMEFEESGSEQRDPLGGLPTSQAPSRLDIANVSRDSVHRTSVASATYPQLHPSYVFRRELTPLYTTEQEQRERRRTRHVRLLRFRYEAQSIPQIVANCVVALREAELQGHLAAAHAGCASSKQPLAVLGRSESRGGLCVSLSLPHTRLLHGRFGEHITCGPLNLHYVCTVDTSQPIIEPVVKASLEHTIALATDEEQQARQLAMFEEWENSRQDRLPGYLLPQPDHADLFEVVVSPILFDDKRLSALTSSRDAGEYDKLDFFRCEHAPPQVLHCPPYPVPHRILVCPTPSTALVPMAPPSDADGRCGLAIGLPSTLDSVDVLIPIDASLVSKLLGIHSFRGRLVGEAIPVQSEG